MKSTIFGHLLNKQNCPMKAPAHFRIFVITLLAFASLATLSFTTGNRTATKTIKVTGYVYEQPDGSNPIEDVEVFAHVGGATESRKNQEWDLTDGEGFFSIEVIIEPQTGKKVAGFFSLFSSAPEPFNGTIYLTTEHEAFRDGKGSVEVKIDNLNTIDEYKEFKVKDPIYLKKK